MNPLRIIGPALLVVGVILTVIGINASHSFVDQMSEMFRGRFTDSTTWYIIGGIGITVVGLVCTFTTWRRKPARS
jgi:hypothetical protein